MTRAPFDAAARTAALDAIASEPLDLLIIGGGITGAGTARDAAMRGLRTALVERDDFASGTSSRSSRLIHGGLRYLEHGQFHLVFEASRERRVLLRIAPTLVHPLKFTWPVYRGARVPKWELRAGLMLYDALAMFRNVGRHRMWNAAEIERLEPRLRHDGLVGGATYFDASTNDVRLTLANVRAAADAGARIANHAMVRELVMEQGAVRGAEIVCGITGRTLRAHARCVVNAAGPWGDAVRQLADPKATVGVRGTRGAHIAVARVSAGTADAIAITHPRDGRVMFILPAGDFTIFGTTDTDYFGALDQVRATREDVRYLLEAANHYLPATELSPDDVVAAWAGIRPLVASNAASTAAVSREHAITAGPRGLLTVSGGKLTTYRLMAEQIVDRAEKAIGRAHVRATTADVPLVPGDEREPNRAALGPAVAQAVRHEMALTVSDVLIRRLQLAYERRDNALSLAPVAARQMAPMLGWTESQERDAVADYTRDVKRIFAIE